MRPVTKWQPGNHAQPDGSSVEVTSSYHPYQKAKPALIKNLGRYCSYCEDAYHQDRDLDVEHVRPKNFLSNGVKVYAHLEDKWDNYLLACSTCNGPDNKDTKDVVPEACHLPHLNNTFLSLTYKAGGVVEANPNLTGGSFVHAKNLLNLVGLGKSPADSNPGDTRYRKREKDWTVAERYLRLYEAGNVPIDTIIDLVENRGGWSIWFTVFIHHLDVRKALVERIPGTSRECFDAAYLPIPRNPGCQSDPI